jgi:DNA-binding Lrp family transcriptional regulator
MAVEAYVLVDCAPGKPYEVVDALRKLAGVETAHAVTGSYDVIAFLRAESMAALGDLLSRHIQRLPGIVKTTTHVVVDKTAARGAMERNPGRQA